MIRKGGCRVLPTRHYYEKVYWNITDWLLDDIIIWKRFEGILCSRWTFFKRYMNKLWTPKSEKYKGNKGKIRIFYGIPEKSWQWPENEYNNLHQRESDQRRWHPPIRELSFFIDTTSLLIVFLYPLSSYIYFCQEPQDVRPGAFGILLLMEHKMFCQEFFICKNVTARNAGSSCCLWPVS